MRVRTRCKISVRALQGQILTFTVKSYELEDGFVVFKDWKTNKIKRFHGSNCEIEVLDNGN